MNEKIKEIHGVKWIFTDEYDDSVLQGVSTHKIFYYIKKIDTLPLLDGEIKFSSDNWDFNSVTHQRVAKRKSEFKFHKVHDAYKEQIKFYALFRLWEDKDKIQSIYRDLNQLINFLNYLSSNYIYSIEYLSLDSIKKYLETKSNLAPSTIQQYKYTIHSFYQFYSNNFKNLEWNEISRFLIKVDSMALQAQRASNKWDTIPEEYFNRLLGYMIKIMDDQNAPIDDRGISSMIVMLSQTGLRNGEICDCPTDSLKSTVILNGEKVAYYMQYITTKGVKGNGNFKEVNTVMTELACRAYRTLEHIYKEQRKERHSNLLFVPLKAKTLPVTENTLSRMLTNICLKYGHEIECINVHEEYPKLHHQNIGKLMERKAISNVYLSKYKPSDIISIPRPHQFRVKLCNEFIEANVPLLYIKRHMNHLYKEVTLGYQRQKEDLEQEREFAESVMKMLVTGETEIIGDGKDTLMLRINEYINNSKLNVATDLDAIISDLTKKVPIRAKNGGICIKSGPIRECNKSDTTDELFCAYGMCINLFHAFFLIDINYGKYKTLVKTIKYNQDKGFKKAVEKETGKLKWIIEKYLIPELDELSNEVATKGEEKVKRDFPQVSFFIDNYDSIYKELVEWLK